MDSALPDWRRSQDARQHRDAADDATVTDAGDLTSDATHTDGGGDRAPEKPRQ